MGGAAPVVVAAAGAALGFDAFLAKAPEVETARIASPTRTIFFILMLSLTWKKDGAGLWRLLHPIACAVGGNPHWGRKFPASGARALNWQIAPFSRFYELDHNVPLWFVAECGLRRAQAMAKLARRVPQWLT